jgi:pilus assembly protein FimV
MLRSGAILRLPDDATLRAVAAEEAAAEVRRQHQVWEEYRQQIGAAPAAQPLGTTPVDTAATPAAPAAAGDARLELVAPGGTAEGGGTPGASGQGAGGTELIAEQLDATAQQATDLKAKLSEAEEIIDLLQRQVNIKDQELAALQARLAELGIEHGEIGATPTEGTTPETPAATEAPAETTDAVPAESTAAESTTPEADTELLTEEAPTEPSAPAEPAATEDSVVTADEPVIEDEPADVASEAETAAATPPPPNETPPPDIEVTESTEQAGFPANLIPAGLAAKVPGGALSIIGAIVLVVLGAFAALVQSLLKSRGGRATPVAVAVPAAVRPGPEDVTVTAAPATDDDFSAATDFNKTDSGFPAFDPNATVEAAAAEPTARPATPTDTPDSDPLEEVNVYLAYERFDQAEELVKRVIAQYPHRHEYKARLLEVYYSSNDRPAYENAARELLNAVGDKDPLWESALAMWAEMSPERALFAAGAATAAAAAAPAAASAFVDITGDGDAQPGEATVTHAPGGRTPGGLDLDLGSAGDAGGILDLTAGSDDNDILDLTSSADRAADEGVFDLTAGAEAGTLELDDAGGLLDITGGNDGGDSTEMLDISAGEAGGSDLLDVTKTGDISMVEDLDLLNITSPGMRGRDEQAQASATRDDDGGLDIVDTPEVGAPSLDFDISDTVAPAFTAQRDALGDGDDILDLTGGSPADDSALEFDIGGLDEGAADTVELAQAPAAESDLDFDLSLGDDGTVEDDIALDATMAVDDIAPAVTVSEQEDAGGGLEITMEADAAAFDGELSLKGAELDALATATAGEEEFDFALDGTTEMDPIAADDTLDMANVVASNVSDAGGDDTTSLDDLTIELDSALSDSAFSDSDGLDTVALQIDDDELGLGGNDQTIVMPMESGVDRQSDADETETKINLAKAYIELGDKDVARSILDEIAHDGTLEQQAEARNLLAQLGA